MVVTDEYPPTPEGGGWYMRVKIEYVGVYRFSMVLFENLSAISGTSLFFWISCGTSLQLLCFHALLWGDFLGNRREKPKENKRDLNSDYTGQGHPTRSAKNKCLMPSGEIMNS